MYLRGIESDLERRVPAELADAGIDGVQAAFRGQEGVLHCRTPLRDPEHVLDLAHQVSGVVVVELDRSCRVTSAPVVVRPDPTDEPGAATEPSTQRPVEGETDPDEEADLIPGFDSVEELLDTAPRFSLFATLLRESGLTDLLVPDGDVLTVFAPVDEAFDQFPPDVIAELRTRPEQLAEVMRHHIVEGVVDLADLRRTAVDGSAEITTTAGGTLPVEFDGPVPMVGDARVLEGDLRAGNGVVHAIDRLLLPAGLELRALEGFPELVVVFRSGALELSGAVPSEAERIRLLAAANRVLAADNVTHDLLVDPDSTIESADVVVLVQILEVLPRVLASGSAGFDGSVFVRGVAVDASGREELAAIAGPDAAVEIELRPLAGSGDLEQLQQDLDSVLTDRPLRFEPGTAEPTADGAATLDVIAALVKRLDGVFVTVEGHTDTAGDPQANLELSELRAAVVLLELALRGVPAEQLDLVGRGGSVPILVDGVEDRAASRRVELIVGSTPSTP